VPLERVEKSDDFVWDLPGFEKYKFYVAADYLRRKEKSPGFREVKKAQASTNAKVGLATANNLKGP
jgi:hypothetical protein